MQKIIFYTVILIVTFASKAFAQDKTFEKRANEIGNQIETITKEEKKALKIEIETIDKQIANGKISKEKAEELKIKKAEERAANIEAKVSVEQEKLTQLIQDKVDGKFTNTINNTLITDNIIANGKEYEVKYTETDSTDIIYDIKRKFSNNNNIDEKRTTSQLVFASGFNNLVTNNQVANSDFSYLNSTFFEWGFTFRTNIIKDKSLLNFKYGVSFMYNQLNASDNRYFVDNGSQTVLNNYPTNLVDRNTYFKNVYIAVPLHLEFDFSKPQTHNKSHNGYRLGIGGFIGYNINSKQFLEYKVNDYRISEKQKGDWNVNDVNYGLSTYVGYKNTSLYLKYDMNPLFKNNAVDQNNISLGVRFDFN